MDSDRVGIRVAGRGGQGIMLAGFLLAQAGMKDGLQVVQTQSYGPEARLGAAKSDVILSTTEIANPEIALADVFLCLSHDAFVAYGGRMRPGGLRVVDERVAPAEAEALVALPLTRVARECGSQLAANIVGLGVLAGIDGVVSERSLREALVARVAPDSVARNTRAFDAGLRLGAACRVR